MSSNVDATLGKRRMSLGAGEWLRFLYVCNIRRMVIRTLFGVSDHTGFCFLQIGEMRARDVVGSGAED